MPIRQLIERRVPHFLIVYIGVGWGVVQFFDFMERYGISPHWTDLTLLALALLLPSVVLFTYNHGRPGKDEITRSDKIVIPLNVIAAGVVLYMVFGGKSLAATTRTINLIDESGKEVEHKVANPSYHKRLALFDFDAAAGDTSATWLRYALPVGLTVDLAQNMFIDVSPSAEFRERLRELKLPLDASVPIALKRQLAEERHIPFFTDASITRSGDQIAVSLGLYESAQGNQVARHEFKNSDVFALVDEITVALRNDLALPDTKDTKDLHVSDVLTTSMPAYRSFVDGITEIQVKRQWQPALPKLEKAVELDPQFAQAQFALHNVLLLANQAAKSMVPLQKAMDYEYRMPERQRYSMRAEYFTMKQEKDKALAIANMQVQLYPQDIAGYGLLAQFQQMRGNKEGVVTSLKKILELDPSQQEIVQQIGAQYEGLAEFDSALHYYSRYAELYPNRKEPFVAMAGVNRLRGESEQARANYNKALLNAPEDLSAQLGLAGVSMDVGDFDGAEKQYEAELTSARTSNETGRVLDALANYYEIRGQFNKSIGYRERALAENRKTDPPIQVDVRQLSGLGAYVRAGRAADANRILKSIAARLQPPFTLVASMGEMDIALEQGNVANAEKAAAEVEQGIQVAGFDVLKSALNRGKARLAELKGNCQDAIKYREEQIKLEPNSIGAHADIARCYRTLGETQKAMDHAGMLLKVRPFDPRANYEIGLDYLASNDRAKALEHLQRAMQVWSAADPTYKLAAEAKARLAELTRN